MKFRRSSGNTPKTYILKKVENLEEMNKFLDEYDLPKLNQWQISHLYQIYNDNDFEVVIKIHLTKKKASTKEVPVSHTCYPSYLGG
jgi:hypothetical protein